MKIGKVFGKLVQDKRVKNIHFMREGVANVVLAEGFYADLGRAGGTRSLAVTTARQAQEFIRKARPLPTAEPGHHIDFNMMSGLPIQVKDGTPGFMNPARESYWSL